MKQKNAVWVYRCDKCKKTSPYALGSFSPVCCGASMKMAPAKT